MIEHTIEHKKIAIKTWKAIKDTEYDELIKIAQQHYDQRKNDLLEYEQKLQNVNQNISKLSQVME